MQVKTRKKQLRTFSALIFAAVLLWSMFIVSSSREAANTEVNSDLRHSALDSDGAPSVEWNTTFGGPSVYDEIHDLVQTDDGGYAMAGSTTSWGAGDWDSWLVRTDADGNVLWNKTVGGADEDLTWSLVQTDDGGFALERIIAQGSNRELAFSRFDKDGNLLFDKKYGDQTFKAVFSLVRTLDGGYAMGGYSGGFWLVKIDFSGNMEWNWTYWPDPLAATAFDMVQTSDGGYAMAGEIGPFILKKDIWLVKTDAGGNMLWNKTYGGTENDRANGIVQTDDGGYALAGYTLSFGAGASDFWLIRTDIDGNMLWNKTFGDSGDEIAYSIVQTHDGGFALAGFDDNNTLLIKTDANGDEQWNLTLGYTGGFLSTARSMIQDSEGAYALAGSSGGDGWLAKIAPESNLYHDVDLVRLATSKRGCVPKPTAGQNTKVNVSMTVRDQGSYQEVFNVTVYVNATAIATIENIELPSDNSAVLNVTWDTSGYAIGYYRLSAYVSNVTDEADTSDNIRYESILLTIPGDINGDFTVNILDSIIVGNSFLLTPITSEWNPNADINNDNVINILDSIIIGNHFLEHYP